MATGFEQRFKGKVEIATLFVGKEVDSVASTVTASTTHSIAGATPLAAIWNVIATCANAGDAVALPASVPGAVANIVNSGAAAAGIYPAAATDAIDTGAAGSPATLSAGKRAAFICIAAGTWVSAQLGVASA